MQPAFASWIATVAEVEVDADGEVTLRRMVCAVDTGIAVNPDTVVAQLQGGLIFGLTAALYGEITDRQGPRPAEQLPRLPDAAHQRDAADRGPRHPQRRGAGRDRRGRHGRRGPPALANAIFAATGKRLRRLPIDRDILAGRKPA